MPEVVAWVLDELEPIAESPKNSSTLHP
jgi:hypothetical protein